MKITPEEFLKENEINDKLFITIGSSKSGPTGKAILLTELLKVYSLAQQKEPLMFEDDLPPMNDNDYSKWFSKSKLVDGVRMGPLVNSNSKEKEEQPEKETEELKNFICNLCGHTLHHHIKESKTICINCTI